MDKSPSIATLAALIGDPARARMLLALMQGGARTLSELAAEAGIGLPTASAHATQLAGGGLIKVRKSGRHKYMDLASAEVASVIEHLMALQTSLTPGDTRPRRQPGPRDAALREARVCYDHLAGARGVQMFQSLVSRGALAQTADGLDLTQAGRELLLALPLGLGPQDLLPGKPPLCRECLDWSERQSHLAGRLGRHLLASMRQAGWLDRDRSAGTAGRRLLFSAKGAAAFRSAFPPLSGASPLDGAGEST